MSALREKAINSMNDAAPEQSVGDRADTARLVAAIALVAAGIAAFYVLAGKADWLRWGCVVGGVVLGAVVFAGSARGRAFWQFMQDARMELRKVVWPTRQETGVTTLAVFLFVTVAGLFFWLLDLFLSWATRWLTGQGG